jgi:hypothetical protein
LTKSRADAILSLYWQQETMMKSLKILLAVSLIAATVAPGVALAKKKSNGGGTPSEVQRKRAYAQGLKDCRKQWGSQLHEVHVEKYYGKWSVVCYHY